MDTFIDFCGYVGVPILICALALAGLFFGAEYGIERPSCYAHWRDSGLRVRWSIYGDCQVSSDGKHWITDDAFTQTYKQVAVKPGG